MIVETEPQRLRRHLVMLIYASFRNMTSQQGLLFAGNTNSTVVVLLLSCIVQFMVAIAVVKEIPRRKYTFFRSLK